VANLSSSYRKWKGRYVQLMHVRGIRTSTTILITTMIEIIVTTAATK
jgi:hypothetical protein